MLYDNMEKLHKHLNNFSGFQKVLFGIALAFFAIYKFWLKTPEIKSDLGVAYPWFLMVWVILMLVAAGLSGWQLVAYLPNPKTFLPKKQDEDNKDEE